MDLLTKKVTVSAVNRKQKELRQLHGISPQVYHPNWPIHDSPRMLYASCGEEASSYTGCTVGNRTYFRLMSVTSSMQQALCMQL